MRAKAEGKIIGIIGINLKYSIKQTFSTIWQNLQPLCST